MTMLPDIPGDFEVGASIGGGNCFYDSVAQGLRQVHPDKSFTVDSLRSDCKTLAESLLDEESWLKDVPKSEIPEDYVRLVGISTSGDGIPIWGRPEIEGRMLCDVHNIRIHVVEYQTPGDGRSLFVGQLVQKTGSISVNNVDYGAPDIIHIINNGDMHFEPVLRKSVCTDHNCVDTKQSCEPMNKGLSSSSNNESVTLNCEMTQIICGKLPQEDKLKELATLFNLGADVNFKYANRKCDTPLHLAIREKDMKVVEFLLSKHPDLSIGNKDNKTALDLAKDMGIDLPGMVSRLSKKSVTEDEVRRLPNCAFPEVPRQNQDGAGRTVNVLMSASSYKKRPGTGGIDGHLLEILLLIIFKLRGEKRMEEFYLAGNMDGIGACDDVVFRYNNNKKVSIIFLQAKYKEDPLKYHLTLGGLRNSDDFKLSKYFQSYMKVKEMFKEDSDNVIFKGKFEEVDTQFVIYTNAVRDNNFDANRIVDCMNEMSNLLKIGNEGRFLKLKAEDTENQDIISEMCETVRADPLAKLAKQFMKLVLSGRMSFIMSDPIIKLHHVFLADKVVEIVEGPGGESGSEQQSKKLCAAQFRNYFLKGEIGNEKLMQFRRAIFISYAENCLVSRKENAPSFTCDEEMMTDAKKLANMIRGANSNEIEIGQIKDESILVIICKLSGNVIGYNKTNEFLEFTVKETLGEKAKICNEEIQKNMKNKAVIENCKFHLLDEVVQTKLKEMCLMLPEEFGNVRPKLKRSPEDIAKEVAKLLEPPNPSKNIEPLKLGADLVKDVGRLVGNVLKVDEESGLAMLTDMELEGDLQIIREKVKELATDFRKPFALPNEIRQLYLNCIPQDKKCAQEFLKKLVICTGQHGPEKLKEVATNELRDIYKLTKSEGEDTYLKLKESMTLWWGQKGNSDFLKRGDGFLNNIVKRCINFDVKHPVESFCGREKELSTLHEALLSKDRNNSVTVISQMASISGLGGIGKSELARKYAMKYGEKYDNNVIWIDAEKSESMSDSFRRLCCDKLGISTKNASESEKDIKSIVQDVYNFFAKRKCLFIFDNAQRYKTEDCEDGIEDYLPQSLQANTEMSGIIVTSQNQMWPTDTILQLDSWSNEEADSFVRHSLGIVDDSQDTDISSLLKLMQNFPLALQQAVALIKVRDKEARILSQEFRISHFVKSFVDDDKNFLDYKFPEGSADSYKKTTLKTWGLAQSRIREKENGLQALKILGIMAYLAPNDIPSDIFLGLPTIKNGELGASIALLKQYSLVAVEGSRVNIHRLVQHVVRSQSDKEEKDILRQAASLLTRNDLVSHKMAIWGHIRKHVDLASAFSNIPDDVINEFVADVRYKDAYEYGKQVMDDIGSGLAQNHVAILRIKNSVAGVLHKEGEYQKAINLFKYVFDERCAKLGEDHADTLRTQHNIADVLFSMKLYDFALTMHRDVLDRRKRILGPEHLDTLATQNNMAHVLQRKGKSPKALKLLMKVLKRRMELLGPSHTDTLNTRKIIADLKCRQRKYKGALVRYSNVYDIEVALLGRRHPNTLTTLNSIATVLVRMGNGSQALVRFKDLWETRKEVLGSDHPDTLIAQEKTADMLDSEGDYGDSLIIYEDLLGKCHHDERKSTSIQHNIADLLVRLGRDDEALTLYQEISRRETRTLNRERLFQTQMQIPEILNRQGKFQEAFRAYETILENQAAICGPDDESTLTVKSRLAKVLRNQEKYGDALKLYGSILNKQKQVLGPDHESTLHTRSCIAGILNKLGKYKNVMAAYRDIFKREYQTLGPNHQRTLITSRKIAEVFSNQGKYDEAFSSYLEVYKQQVKLFGQLDPDTLKTMRVLPTMLCRQGKHKEALKPLQYILEMQTRILGFDHRDTLNTGCSVANLLNILESYFNALQLYYKLYEAKCRAMSPEHPSTLITQRSIAEVLCRLEQYDDAMRTYRQVFETQTKILGSDHKETLITHFDIANCLDVQDKCDEAFQAYNEVYAMKCRVLGPQHPDTLCTQRIAADVLCGQGRYEEALRICRDVYNKQLNALGQQHDETMITSDFMKFLLHALAITE